MSATIETIASMVGCSVATVSRVINNIEPVSKPMREAILKAMRETNYTPRRKSAPRKALENFDEEGLIDVLLHSSRAVEHYSFPEGRVNIDFIESCTDSDSISGSDRIADSFFRSIVDGICAELSLWNFRPVLQMTTDLFSPGITRSIQRGGTKGIVVAGIPSPRIEEFLTSLGKPAVLADVPSCGSCPMVTVDSRRGIELAFEHLHNLGHRKIGFLWGAEDNPVYRERYNTLCFCINAAGLEMRQDWVYRGTNQVAATAQWAHGLLQSGDFPTAFVSSSDITALGLLRAASEQGIAIPGRISLVGFDDIDAATVVNPPLTSVRVPAVEIGREAARQLILQINSERLSPIARKITLEPELIVRSSTAPLSG